MELQITKFYNDELMKTAVYGIIEAEIEKMSIDYIKSGKDASGFKEAFLVLEQSFQKMKKIAK